MQSHFVSRALSVAQLFSDPFLFEAPAYQRPYAWTVTEAGRLLDDVLAAHEEGGPLQSIEPSNNDYFLGTILLDDPVQSVEFPDGWPWSGKSRVFHIVDGQQRLVTLTLLFCVLRNLIADHAPTTAAALHRCVMASVTMSDATSSYRRIRLRGTDDVSLADLTMADRDGPRAINGALSDDVQHGLVSVYDHFTTELANRDAGDLAELARFLLEHCAIVAIATRNIDRAHRMFTVLNNTGKDLARSDILKAELLGGIASEDADRYVAIWDDMNARLGANFEQLFGHIRTVQGRTSGAIIETIRRLIRDAGSAARFIDDTMVPAAQVFEKIIACEHSGTPQSTEIAQLLRYCSWVQGQEWVPVVMAVWLKHRHDAAALLAFMRAFDRHLFGVRILGLGSDKRTQRLTPVLAAIRSDALLDELSQLLAFSKDECRSIAKNLRELYTRNQTICKLVLLRINDHLSGRPEHANLSHCTVEHVLPVRPATDSVWRIWYPDTEERAQCAQCLGNLTLVSRAQNDAAKNLDLALKLPVYFPPGNSVSMRLLEDFRGLRDWRRDAVRQREAVMLAAVMELWGVGSPAMRSVVTSQVAG
jgi:hypothetical protein